MAVGLGKAGVCMALWSGWRAGVRGGMWESMNEAMLLLVKCNSGMATLGVCV